MPSTIAMNTTLAANCKLKKSKLTVNLHALVRQGKSDELAGIISESLINSNKLFDLDSKDCVGYTALHEACSKGFVEIVRLLVDHGANIDAKTNGGWTPLHCASDGRNFDCVKYLLEKGANINAANYTGLTALHLSTLKDKLQSESTLSLFLLSKGANLTAKDTSGWSPIDTIQNEETRALFFKASEDFENSKDWQRRSNLLLFLHGCKFNTSEEVPAASLLQMADAPNLAAAATPATDHTLVANAPHTSASGDDLILPKSSHGYPIVKLFFAHDHCFGIATFL